jgi:hypothetical protein
MNLNCEIIVVSGLPRSGTSLMMQMLHAGGIEVVSDHVRTADVDNPRGYFEFERVKQVGKDASWMPEVRGKAVKMVSPLLYHLPPTEQYRIVFMQRNLEEIVVSQEKMLQRRNAPIAPRDQILDAYAIHLDALFQWLPGRSNMRLLTVNYNDLVREPRALAERVSQFLDGQPAADDMMRAVHTDLYRNRSHASTPCP